MEIRLLGPLEVDDERGRPVELPRRKQRAALAALALRCGRVVSTDRLLEDLWGTEPPRTAVGSLQNLVSQLRKALGGDVVVTRPPGYVLAVAPEQTDVGRLEVLVARAHAASSEERAGALREALALWRGPPLADLAFEPFAGPEVARLDELRAALREELVVAELGLGRHVAAIPELEALVAEHPLRERPRALLMLALYRAERQTEALEAYHDARRYLRDELGLEPGHALQKLQQGILRRDPALDAPSGTALQTVPGEERRVTVTVLFADLADSTELAAGLDPEAYRSVLRSYYRTARAALEHHGGTVEKFVGDAVVAVFGVPVRREDDALRAVRAGADLRRAVAELNGELRQRHGVEIRLRVGINTGEAIAGDPGSGESFATGYAVNVAAKLEQHAPEDGVLIGASTYRLVRDAVATTPAEPLLIGRSASPLPAFLVTSVTSGAAGVARQLSAPLIDRAHELEALRSLLQDAHEGGESRVATMVADAGIGKTRLANELARSLGPEGRVLVGHCVSYGEGATWLPVAEIVRAVVPDASETGIAAVLGDDADARLAAHGVRGLLGLVDAAPAPGEAFWAVRRLLEAIARRQPLLLVLDDIHWAEPTLLDLVESLDGRPAPMLVLCLARPDLLGARPDWKVSLRLEPLPRDAAARLVAALPGGGSVDEGLRRRIVEVAEGNALFAEQLLAHVLESGDGALDDVPGGLEALIASRLDRLPEGERRVLERAAVVGRSFPRAAVAELSEDDVAAPLAALTAKGLVRPARGEDFLFHHVLIRDVAYAGVTKERRSRLHQRVAGWLDAGGSAGDALVGYHLEQSYRCRAELGPDDDEARGMARAAGERLAKAGTEAWKRADAPAAVNLLARAADLLPPGEVRAEALCELGSALWSAGQGASSRAMLEAALDEASAAGSARTELRARVELTQAGLYGVGGLVATADDVLEAASAAIPVLDEAGDDRALGRVWLAVADVQNMRLNNRAWGDAAATAVSHYRKTGFSPSVGLSAQAAALYAGPTPVLEALRRCRRLVDDADGDRHATASVVLFAGGLHAMRREFAEARALTDEARATLAELEASYALAGQVMGIGAEIARLAGDLETAESLLRESRDLLEAMGQGAYVATRNAQLADVLCDRGRVDEAGALAALAESGSVADDLVSQVYWRSVRARLLARSGGIAEAEALAREALELIDRSDALNQRAKATLDLADVLRLARRPPEELRSLADRAVRLYRRKGNLVAASRAQTLLDEPAAAPV